MLKLEFEYSPCIEALIEQIADRKGRFLIEDVGGRTAIIGAEPSFVLNADDGAATNDPLSVLDEHLAKYRADVTQSDIAFAGGAVGYFSYDLGRTIENIPSIAVEDVPTPDLCFGFYDSALNVDLNLRKCTAVSWSGDREALADWKRLALSVPEANEAPTTPLVHCPGEPVEIQSNFTRHNYLAAIGKIKDYIAAGDVYQVNLSQRFNADLSGSPWELYKALRRINPAPKSCYMEIGGLYLLSASPEVYLTYDPISRLIVTKPIKGTRPRGMNPNRDAILASELAGSEKDRAENLMIVDMERNDLGRVAKYGSVRVPELWNIEKHPNVFQMVSTVEAELADGYGPIDLIRASFPGGSITGAPKIRAMEIIEELEPHRRGIYTGSAGFIDYRGFVNLNIVIRSFVMSGSKAYFHAGGGIVIDSVPEDEYQETMDKIAGLRAALRESGGT